MRMGRNMEDQKERAIDRLTSAYAASRISMEEFERRAELVSQAENEAELRRLVEDVPREATHAPSVPTFRDPIERRADASAGYLVNRGKAPKKDEFAALFSTAERVGTWTAARHFEAAAIFGTGLVDLRDAIIPREGMKIEAAGIFGSLVITVPRGVNVRVKDFALFGSVSGGGERFGDDDGPLIEIEAVGIFGSCTVKYESR